MLFKGFFKKRYMKRIAAKMKKCGKDYYFGRFHHLRGMEYVTSEPSDYEDDVLYFVLSPETGTLTKIMLNGLTIFSI